MTLDERPTTMTDINLQISRPSSILLIGLGNPILGDDGVGWKIVQEVEAILAGDPPAAEQHRTAISKIRQNRQTIEMDYLSLGGLSLMERMLGYGRVILVDSMETGTQPVGKVSVFALSELPNPSAGHSASAHDTSLITALKTAEAIGAAIPSMVEVVAVEALNAYDFKDELTPEVSKAVPVAVNAVLELLGKI